MIAQQAGMADPAAFGNTYLSGTPGMAVVDSINDTGTQIMPGGPVPAEGETVTIKFDPHRRREFVLLEESGSRPTE